MKSRPVVVMGVARVLIMAAVVVVTIIIVIRFDFESMPESVTELRGRVRPGAMMVLGTVDGDTPIGVGTLLEVVMNDEQGRPRRFFSEVAAVEGQVVALKRNKQGMLEVFVDGRTTWKVVPPSSPLVEGRIGSGYLLMLDPAPDAEGTDSRKLGLIPLERVRRKILFAL